ncbi:MAG: DUF5752 family protein [Methanothrix sp.]|nr:DUF5752 family protein [Methanothrix sp.]
MSEAFHFYTQYHLVEMLGLKARNPGELLEGIKAVPASSIYYHTHRFLQQHHYLSPEPPNDFAFWLMDILHLNSLGEKFLSIDTVHYCNLEDLRKTFQGLLEDHISKDGTNIDCLPGFEFHFLACKTLVLPMPYVANNLREFAEILKKVSIRALYFHIFEARMRLGVPDNDFSQWLRGIGEEQLAAEISRLDPYNMTLESLRRKLIRMVGDHVQS